MKGIIFEKKGDIVHAESDTFVYKRVGGFQNLTFKEDISEDNKFYINAVIEKIEKILEEN